MFTLSWSTGTVVSSRLSSRDCFSFFFFLGLRSAFLDSSLIWHLFGEMILQKCLYKYRYTNYYNCIAWNLIDFLQYSHMYFWNLQLYTNSYRPHFGVSEQFLLYNTTPWNIQRQAQTIWFNHSLFPHPQDYSFVGCVCSTNWLVCILGKVEGSISFF